MKVQEIIEQHDYKCHFGCKYVKNLDIQEVGNGFICKKCNHESPKNMCPIQNKSAYCCADGPAGVIPGCPKTTKQADESTTEKNGITSKALSFIFSFTFISSLHFMNLLNKASGILKAYLGRFE